VSARGPFQFIPGRLRQAHRIAGFEQLDIPSGESEILGAAARRPREAEDQYKGSSVGGPTCARGGVAEREGVRARMRTVEWRGLGFISHSGL